MYDHDAKQAKVDYNEWRLNQVQFNDGRLEAGLVSYPVWQLSIRKRLRVEYNFGSRNTYVCLEQAQDSKQFTRILGIKLNANDWTDLFNQCDKFRRFVCAVEGSDGCSEKPEDIFKHWNLQKYCGWLSCQVPVNDEIRVTYKWKEGDQSQFFIDFRRGVMKCVDNQGMQWIPCEKGIALSGSTLKFFLEHVAVKAMNSVRMWNEMSRAGYYLQESLFSTYKPENSRRRQISWTRIDPVEDELDFAMDTTEPCDPKASFSV